MSGQSSRRSNDMDVQKTSSLMVILVLYFRYSQAQGTAGCAYTYQEQPPTNLECNPYPNNDLILKCEVWGPIQMPFSIVWYWEPLNSQQPQRLSADISKYDFNVASAITINSRSRSSQLRVQQLNDNDAGWYFCLGNLSNGTLLTPSNRLFLSTQSEHTSALNASTCPDRAQSTRVPSCASIASDTSSTVSTTTPNLATGGNRGSTDPTSSLPTDHSFLLATTAVTLTPTPTMAAVPDPESDMLQVVLPLVAVVAVFCVIIVTLGFIIVILICRKKPGHVKSKTADQDVGANTFSPVANRLCICTCMKSGGAESRDIPMEECVAYGTNKKRRGRGDTTIAMDECPAYGVEKTEQGMTQEYESLEKL